MALRQRRAILGEDYIDTIRNEVTRPLLDFVTNGNKDQMKWGDKGFKHIDSAIIAETLELDELASSLVREDLEWLTSHAAEALKLLASRDSSTRRSVRNEAVLSVLSHATGMDNKSERAIELLT